MNIDQAFNDWTEKALSYKCNFTEEDEKRKLQCIVAYEKFENILKLYGGEYITDKVIFWYNKEDKMLNWKWTI